MSEFTHNVDIAYSSQRVYDDEGSEWIRYTSPTDALIAKLHLEAHIPSPYINAFLSVLTNPHFKLKELSFQRCADIDRSVAAYRRVRALDRASASGARTVIVPPAPAPARLPFDILALVIESITSERLPLRTNDPSSSSSSSIFGKPSPGSRQLNQRIASRLKSLALTHRTLTPLAQRSLGQRLIVQNARDLRALMRSPLLGPWTTELLLNLHFPSGFSTGSGYGYATVGTGGGRGLPGFTGWEDIIQSATDILQNPLLKELKFLRIRTPAYLEQGSTEYLNRLLKVIGSNFTEKLETLWWIVPKNASRYARVDLEEILRATRGLRSLKSLVVQNVQCGWVEGFNDAPSADAGDIDIAMGEGISTHTQLEELSLMDLSCPAGPLEGTCLSWLLNSSSCSTLKSLTLRLNSSSDALESLFASSPSLLTSLGTLSLKLTEAPDETFFSRIFHPSSSSSSPEPPADTPTNLHTLHLSCEPSPIHTEPTDQNRVPRSFLTSSTLLQIPTTIRHIHLELSHLARLRKPSWMLQQNELVRFVLLHDIGDDGITETGTGTGAMRRRNLEEMEITVPMTRSDRSFSWDLIEETCKARGVNFVLRKEVL